MDTEAKQDFIRWKARQNRADPEGAKIRWPRHGIAELVNEGWSRVLLEGGCKAARLSKITRPGIAHFLIA